MKKKGFMAKLWIIVMVVVMAGVFMSVDGCTDADIASSNLSKRAEQFEVFRKVVFYNGITGEHFLEIQAYCSIKADTLDKQLELTGKYDDGTFFKHFLGLSDNVTYFVEQMEGVAVSDARYRVIFKPSVIIPNIDLE